MKTAVLTALGLGAALTIGAMDASAQQGGDIPAEPPPLTNAGDGRKDGSRAAPSPDELPRPKGMPEYLVKLTRADCLEILKYSGDADYVPPPDVTYQPGVDVRGNKVAPADLSGTTALGERLAEEITFELAINPLDYAGDPDLAERLSESRLALGVITVDRRTGEVRLDGDVLSRRPPKELIRACEGALGLTR